MKQRRERKNEKRKEKKEKKKNYVLCTVYWEGKNKFRN
jgi:hypothetical protein